MATSGHSPDGLSDLTDWLRHQQALVDGRARPESSVRRRRTRKVFAIVLAVLIAAAGGYAGWALTVPLGPPAVTWHSLQTPVGPAASIALPAEGASAISISGADEYLGSSASGIWLSSGTDEPRPIASVSKLITALVILDARPLASADDPGPTITFDKADHDLYDKYYVLGATIAAMPAGSSMSLRDALATMLIPSASNYAEAVSTWAFGSQGAFVAATREWLGVHGLTGTTIVEPTGLSARNVSTPGDLITIGKLAAADPVIAQIAATPSLSLPGPGGMSNTNKLLGDNGIDGLKTGNLGEGTFSLLYTSSLEVGAGQPLEVTGVLLGGATRRSTDAGVLALLDSIRDGFHHVPVATLAQEVGTYSTPWGSTGSMVLSQDASLFTWSDTPITATTETVTPASFEDGAEAGSITWTAGPNAVTVGVEVEGSLRPPDAWWRLTHPAELVGR